MKRTYFYLSAFVALMSAGCGDGNGNDPIPADYHNITVTADANGTAVARVNGEIVTKATEGTKITLAATPDEGYLLSRWVVEGGEATLTDDTSNPATIRMPSGDVSVKARIDYDPVFRGEDVEIGGIKWAARNVGAPGTFAAKPEDAGMFYQWNHRTGWSGTDPITSSPDGETWDAVGAAGKDWKPENDPCPEGWRMPTKEEFEVLAGSGSTRTRINDVNGRRFGSGDRTIFLPAAGARVPDLGGIGREGYYWSATPTEDDGYGYGMTFNLGTNVSTEAPYGHQMGFSVRCVSK